MKEERCYGAIVESDGKILLVHHNEGHWGFPKGHIEDGEDPLACAIREVKEETNIDITIDSPTTYTTRYSSKPNVMKTVIFYIGKPINLNAVNQAKEVSEVKWVSFDLAFDLLTFSDSKEILKQYIQDKNSNN